MKNILECTVGTDSNVPDHLVETDEEDEQNENEEATSNQKESNQEEALYNYRQF